MNAPEATAKPKRSLGARILFNAMSGAGNRIATMAIGFLLTPVIIAALGLSTFGLWSVIGTLSSYLGLFDFGVGGAFVKFITEYVERNDRASARQVVIFGMVFYAAFGLVLAAPVFVLAPQIIHLFKMPPEQYATGAVVLRVVFGLIVFFMIANVPGMVVVSMHRMDLASRNSFFAYLMYAATSFVLLKLHYGIAALIAGQASAFALVAILHVYTATRLFGSLWHNPLRIERAIVRRVFSFGGWTQITSILSAVNQDFGRFVGAGAVGVSSVAIFEIANKPAFAARMFPAYILDALMPALVAADTRGDEAALQRMYASGTRYCVFVALAIAGAAIGGADPLVRVWLGKAYPLVSSIVFWLAAGFALSALSGVGTTLLRASGKPQYETYYMGVATAGTVVASFALVRPFGIVGVAMGAAVGWLAATIYFFALYHRLRPSVWWATIGWPVLRMVVACVPATVALYELVHVPAIARSFENRPFGSLVFVASSVAYGVLFVALTLLLGVWSQDGAQIAARLAEIRERLQRGMFRLQGGGA